MVTGFNPFAASVAIAMLLISLAAPAAVKDFSKHYSLALTTELNDFLLGVSSTEKPPSSELRFKPNTVPAVGPQVSAFGFTVAYKRDAARDPVQDENKGKTSYEDIRAAFNFGKKDQWMLVAYYNRYGGLYIENSSAVDPAYEGQSRLIQRNDFNVFNTGLSAIYVWNPDQFSLPASVLQSAQQTESAGSWLTMAGVDGMLFEATDPIVPAAKRAEFGADALLTSGRFTTASVSVGYGYTLTKNAFYLTGIIMLGPGYQWRRYTVNGVETTSTVNASKAIAGGALGYNGETFFAGVGGIYNQTEYATQSIRFRTSLGSIRFHLGFRF